MIAGTLLTSCFCIQRHAGFRLHTFMTTRPFKLHFAVTEQYFLRPPCLFRSHLFHLTIANLLLSFHGFSTTDCRGSGPRRTCLSSSTVSRRPSFASIWGLHSYPSCGTPEVSILTFKRKPAFDVLLIRMAASRSTSKVGLRLSPLPLLTSMRKSGLSLQTRTRPAIEFVSGEEGPRPASSSISSSIRSLCTWT